MSTPDKRFIAAILLICCFFTYAQTSNVVENQQVKASIEIFLKEASSSVNKVQLEKALTNIIAAKELSLQIKDRAYRAKTNMVLAKLYRELDDLKKAKEQILDAIQIQKEDQDEPMLACSYNLYGSIAIELKDFDKAQNVLSKAEKLIEKK